MIWKTRRRAARFAVRAFLGDLITDVHAGAAFGLQHVAGATDGDADVAIGQVAGAGGAAQCMKLSMKPATLIASLRRQGAVSGLANTWSSCTKLRMIAL